jgi:P4 family phage/plasmid primase-like protien
MPTMIKAFDTYINQFYSQKGEGHTHTRIGDTNLHVKGGVYTILNKEDFYEKYINHVFSNGKMEFLTEKQLPDKGPVLVDFDFRYSTKIETRQHSEENITDMIELYIDELRQMLHIPYNETIPVYIFEKENVNMLESVTKDGIHMIIGIHIERPLQILLRNKVLTKLSDIWNEFPLENTWEEVLDEGITNGHINWQLYGSRKPGHQPYLLTHLYEISIDDNNDICLSIGDIKKFDLKTRFTELTAQYSNHKTFNILDSIKDQLESLKCSKNSQKKSKLKIIDNKKPMNILEITSEQQLEQCIEIFLECLQHDKNYYIKETHEYTMGLTSNFYNPYDKWIRVGWALKNTHESLFITFIAFSAKSDKFSYDNISDFYDMWNSWGTANEDTLTYRSIIYWVKTDNFDKYKEIREKTVDYFVEKTVESDTDFDFAMVLYYMYKDDFICVSIKRDLWYVYKNHRWIESEGGTDLRIQISKELHSIYLTKYNNDLAYLSSGTIDPNSDKGQSLSKKIKKTSEIAKNLKRRGSKDNIMREAKEIFYDTEFIDKVDANPKLLCFNNGVYDFEHKIFRNGKPDDYLSKSTNINYTKLNKVTHKKSIDEINNFMLQLFPKKEVRDYMWEHLASTLIGENNDQTFNIYNGSGSNGKSKLVELMGFALGDYKATVPITLITAKRNTIGSTSSEIVALKGARYAVMQEPSKGDKINEGIMKEITGGDPLQGRALFKDSITFIPQFKLVVCTNTLLDVGSNDEGTWRRICVCEFISKFCKKEDFDNDRENQFELDKKLGGKFNIWAPVLMSMLIEKACETSGLVNICDEVKSSSLSYRNTQDYYSEFISDKVKKCTGSKIKETTLYEIFKSWYQLHHGKHVPKGSELFEYMNKHFGKKVRGVWNNVSILYDDFDPDLDEE